MASSYHIYSRIGLGINQLSFSSYKKDGPTQRSVYSVPLPKSTKMASCCVKGNFGSPNLDSHLISNLQAKNGSNLLCEDIDKGCEGLGIVSFLRGKNFLITGATGFLAKVLIEKILREVPDVGEIYVIIKAKDDEAAKDRLLNEIVNTELFRNLKAMHGKDYKDFMLRKIIPVVGNVREADIGIKPEMVEEIAEKVEIIVNSAANTTFDERYDVALDINTMGPFRLMSLAKRMKRLKLFLHVSTAYVNGERQGVVSEKPFLQGDTISSEIRSNKNNLILDIEEEIKLSFESVMKQDASISGKMKELGIKRARLYGWQDTYVFTKAMGEMVINSMRGDIPVVTIRPSVIESTIREPFPGWMEGNRMMDPIVCYYGKGQLTGFLLDPNGVLDVVPVDMVVNATLAAMAKHGSKTDTGMYIYQVASSNVNPLLFNHLVNIFFEHFKRSPYVGPHSRLVGPLQPLKMFVNINEFTEFVSKDAIEKTEKLSCLVKNGKIYQRSKAMIMKIVKQAMYLVTIYEPYTFYGGRFDNANTEKLFAEMSDEERMNFHFDIRSINWKDYIDYVHIPGLRKHVMKE